MNSIEECTIGSKMERKIDYHVHIGQFDDVYYYPRKVITALANNGISKVYISSTTSCLDWSNYREKEIIISHIEDEINESIFCGNKKGVNVIPLYWVIPKQLIEGDSLESIFERIKYAGFKIHPKAQIWNLHDSITEQIMNDICTFAEKHTFPILIHTGVDDVDFPNKFEKYIALYPKVTFILAHCKECGQILDMFEKYDNVKGESSFCPLSNLKRFYEEGFEKKMLWGTDFPINCYLEGNRSTSISELTKAYAILLQRTDAIVAL